MRRSRVRLLLPLAASVAAVLLIVAGCRSLPHPRSFPDAADAAGGQTIRVGGRDRTFHLHRPSTVGNPAPLVVVLHGGFGSGTQAESAYRWDDEADAAHFLVAYPDGIDRAWSAGGGCCGVPGSTGVDDVAFIVATVDAVAGQVPVDRSRVYATGISNGGLLAYRLACDTNVFAAIGPDSATLLGPCPDPAPVSVIHVHGTADTRIPYHGGTGDGTAHIDGPAIPDLIAAWRATDHCGQPTVTVAGTVTTSVATCPQGRAVELVTLDGAGHQWPGSVSHPVVERALGLDPPSTALDATDTIWGFFATHPKPAG